MTALDESTMSVADPDAALSSVESSENPAASMAANMPPALEVLWVHPEDLIIGLNTRRNPALESSYVAEIRDRGVREFITVRRDDEGRLVVRKGQRRTLAAIRAGVSWVKVEVEPETNGDDKAHEIDRIIDQLAENHHRLPTSEADEVRATQELLALGVSAGQLVRKRHVSAKRGKKLVEVGRSELASTAMDRFGLTLDQATALAEFDDNPEAIKVLTVVAKKEPEQFGQALARLRAQRAEAERRAEVIRELAEAGVRVVDEPDTLFGEIRPLRELRLDENSEPGTVLAPEDHAQCPGHVAWLDDHGLAFQHQPISVVYACERWREHGHVARWDQVEVSSSVPRKIDESAKAARTEARANNKAWDAATEHRREWLRGFFARKAAPKNALAWIGTVLAEGSHDVRRTMEDHHRLACELLGLDEPGSQPHLSERSPHPIAEAIETASPGRITMLMLSIMLAGYESRTSRETWRYPTAENIRYFSYLREVNYPMSDVEQLIMPTEDGQHDKSDDEAVAAEDDLAADSHRLQGQEPAESAEEHDFSQPEVA